MPARSCIVALLTLTVTAVAELCSIGKIGHVHFAEDPSKSAVLASVCCPETCDRCGGVDCWSQPGGLDCCAKHVYDQGMECTEDEETGCVLPKPTAMVLPAQQRERSCLDMWSAAFPNEREVPCHPKPKPAPAHAIISGCAPCAGLGQAVLQVQGRVAAVRRVLRAVPVLVRLLRADTRVVRPASKKRGDARDRAAAACIARLRDRAVLVLALRPGTAAHGHRHAAPMGGGHATPATAAVSATAAAAAATAAATSEASVAGSIRGPGGGSRTPCSAAQRRAAAAMGRLACILGGEAPGAAPGRGGGGAAARAAALRRRLPRGWPRLPRVPPRLAARRAVVDAALLVRGRAWGLRRGRRRRGRPAALPAHAVHPLGTRAATAAATAARTGWARARARTWTRAQRRARGRAGAARAR